MKILFPLFLFALIATEALAGSPGQIKSCPFRLPGPRSGPNRNGTSPHAKATVNTYILNNLFYTGLNLTYQNKQLPINAGKNILDVARSVQLPPELCSIYQPPVCNQRSKFQSFDGSCNNLNQPWLGKSNTPYKRMLAPVYSDGISEIKMHSVAKNLLPNPRVISLKLSTENNQFESSATHFGVVFGQFVTHDFSQHGDISDADLNEIECPCDSTSEFCRNVPYPADEKIMQEKCMRVTRSSAALPSYGCRMDYREQANMQSAFLDASQVYGEDKKTSLQLRQFTGGLMRTSAGLSTGRPYLPLANDSSCSNLNSSIQCFIAGESRTSENLGLAGFQLLFVREHNRIASELALINPLWNDETLYYETRRIVQAVYQHIIYNEHLPVLLGNMTMQQYGLFPLTGSNVFTGYNPRANPSITNEFTTAAYRFGHSMILNKLDRFNSLNQNMSAAVSLFDMIFQVDEAYNAQYNGMESLFIGLLNDLAGKADFSLVDTLQNHLEEFNENGTLVALDLATYNIQRGRDHGIPGYINYRSACNLKPASSFADLADTVSADNIALLASVYEDVADIDLWVGGLAETPVNGGVVGPTFACMIAREFQNLKKGDRFYYENYKNTMVGTDLTAFRLDQLVEIRKVKLSSLVCKDYDISSIQSNPFLVASNTNNRVPCSSFPSMDLTKWKQ